MSLTSRAVSDAAVALLISFATAAGASAQAKPAAPAASAAAKAAHGALIRPWTGDLDGMVKRRVIRVLTPYSKTHYFVDKGVVSATLRGKQLKDNDRIRALYLGDAH